MEQLQQFFERTVAQVPQLMFEKRLAEKLKKVGISVGKATLKRAAKHIFSGSRKPFTFDGIDGDTIIEITDEDIEYVVTETERFYKEQLPGVITRAAEDSANFLLKSLTKKWPDQSFAQKAELAVFKNGLEKRWGKGLDKLRMLLTISREWGEEFFERRRRENGGNASHFEDVMLRLHVRACQVTGEITILLENGYADGAMARWRTLHEIVIVAAVIAKFGPEIAERYVHYQIVESFSALKAYERTHKDLGYKPMAKKKASKIRRDHAKVIKRFGKKFDEEYGWAAHHLNIKEKERTTFARLEDAAGDAMMRSPYKMASYNVHASPKGIYFKLGNLKGSPVLLAGASNAGLTDPAQHAAISLAEITLLVIGDSIIFDDIVTGKIIARLEEEIPLEFWKADKKLHRDEMRHRRTSPEL